MPAFARYLAPLVRPLASASVRHRRRMAVLNTPHKRLVLLGMASVLLLSGCMLSPLFQAPAALMTGVAVLLGLAACSSGGGGGGGGGGDGGGGPEPQAPIVSLTALIGHPEWGGGLRGDSSYGREYTGAALAIGPSVKGDAFATLVIGAPYATPTGTSVTPGTHTRAGRAYVVFGATSMSSLWTSSDTADLMSLSSAAAVRMEGITNYGFAGTAVGIAPNINGDGYPSVLIGAPGRYNTDSGNAWVVYGSSALANVELYRDYGFSHPAALPKDATKGFQLYAGYDSTFPKNFGVSVHAANLNGDGFDDVVVGWKYPASTLIDLSGTGQLPYDPPFYYAGFNMYYEGDADFRGQTSTDGTGKALAKGRFNGDGIDDLAVGAPSYNNSIGGYAGYQSFGAVRVVFGNSSGIAGSAGLLTGGTGFSIVDSEPYTNQLGRNLAVGDVNGDGVDDIAMSDYVTRYDESSARNYRYGRVWVVFGDGAAHGSSQLDLATVAANPALGFNVELPKGVFANSIAVGKVKGDSAADLLIGAPFAGIVVPHSDRTYADREDYNGAVYVVFGGSGVASLKTTDLNGTNGFTVIGPKYGYAGAALAIGDLNGDGRNDVALGAPYDYQEYVYNSSYYLANPGGLVHVVLNGDSKLPLTATTLPAGGYLGNFYSVGGSCCVPASLGLTPSENQFTFRDGQRAERRAARRAQRNGK